MRRTGVDPCELDPTLRAMAANGHFIEGKRS